MNQPLKYFSILLVAFAFLACQNDDASEETPQQQSQQQPGPMGQMQEPAPEVDLSDSEANTFADAAMAAQEIQMSAQKKMIGIIEEEGLDVETYQKIAQSQQMGQTQGAGDVSDEDMEKFERATKSIQDAQTEIQEEVSTAIENEGMEMQRFQEISRAAQQDTLLQRQIREKMQEKMGNQGGMMQQQPPTGN